ncbi:MAG: glycosyltransferase [Acidimicrobiales bacterium]
MAAVDVLQVITSATPRGAERYAVLLGHELAERGHLVRTVALHPGPNPTLDVEVLGRTRFGSTTLRNLRACCRRAPVVVAHGSSTLPATAVATAGTGIPFVYRNIGDPLYWASSWRRRLRTRALLSSASRVVALTDEAGRRVARCYGIDGSRISVIPNGVPARDFPRRTADEAAAARQALSVPPDSVVAVFLGALSPEKDPVAAVEAIGHLPDRWMLFVGGDGPEADRVRRAAGTVAGDRVRLLGHVTDPLALLRAADVLVLSSVSEGLPGVIIEAALLGVPTVATDAGFVRELVRDGINGFVVPVADPAALAAALLGAEAQLEVLGSAAHDLAIGHYTLESTADRWLDVLDQVRSDGAGAHLLPWLRRR